MLRLNTLFTMTAVALLGCGSDAPPKPSDIAGERQEENKATETVFDPMLNSLEKAKGVEDMAAQRKAEMDERLKKETAGDPPD